MKKGIASIYVANMGSGYAVVHDNLVISYKYVCVWVEENTKDGEQLLKVAEFRSQQEASSFLFFQKIFKSCRFIDYSDCDLSNAADNFIKFLVKNGKIPKNMLTKA